MRARFRRVRRGLRDASAHPGRPSGAPDPEGLPAVGVTGRSAAPGALEEELQQGLWPSTFVDEANLSVVVAELRAALRRSRPSAVALRADRARLRVCLRDRGHARDRAGRPGEPAHYGELVAALGERPRQAARRREPGGARPADRHLARFGRRLAQARATSSSKGRRRGSRTSAARTGRGSTASASPNGPKSRMAPRFASVRWRCGSMDGPGRVDGNDRADRLGDSPQAGSFLGTVPTRAHVGDCPKRFPGSCPLLLPLSALRELGGTIPLDPEIGDQVRRSAR